MIFAVDHQKHHQTQISPSCQTLSEALYISKDTSNFYNLSSDDLSIFWVIGNNWLIHKSLGLKPDWFGEIKLLEIKILSLSLKISLSKIFPQIGSTETGR